MNEEPLNGSQQSSYQDTLDQLLNSLDLNRTTVDAIEKGLSKSKKES
ncbi:hypothetical protein ACFQ2K_23845 [Streptomyces sanglieri]|uniref:Uncharacterized protein n=1 Tax=Streptomyces sanglieri TaxID=193460 RepID=A0ABW2WV63_9ACTN